MKVRASVALSSRLARRVETGAPLDPSKPSGNLVIALGQADPARPEARSQAALVRTTKRRRRQPLVACREVALNEHDKPGVLILAHGLNPEAGVIRVVGEAAVRQEVVEVIDRGQVGGGNAAGRDDPGVCGDEAVPGASGCDSVWRATIGYGRASPPPIVVREPPPERAAGRVPAPRPCSSNHVRTRFKPT